jgi:hypothetical protein
MAVDRMPTWLGVNVTGTVSVAPCASVAGKAGAGAPVVNSALVELTELTVVARTAVKTT